VTVVKDALTAYAAGGVTGMHDATEGGVLGGLYEIAEASGVGMEVWEDKCILPPDVLALCKQFDLDPFGVIAEGCLLITAEADAAPNIIAALTREQIPASVIGTILADPAVRIMHRSNGQDDALAVPLEEPFWKIYP
ncbi:MAG TPA: AIR synthase-related protein, partial [Methanocorpusculum sp.]|nr:AIR synthase-related protein [Methanocorpusculum sp.]